MSRIPFFFSLSSQLIASSEGLLLSWIHAAKWKHKHLQGLSKLFWNFFPLFFFFSIHCCEEDHVKGEYKWQGGTLPLLFKRVTNNPLHPSRLLALTLQSLDPSFPSTGLVFPGGLDALWVQEMQGKQRLKVSRSREKGRWQKRLRRPNPPLSNASSYKDLLPRGS